ncbi:GNAT family N-acetyltransferase [Planococcus sp. CP5-4]|uniref:GNAT family N-acetyltransferase n=1 Tax=unclassified Planococcus (in: firmicutes) TaxID=2662419 RepID=UPI001C22B4C7|nr:MULTISPECIES: GNAT family N-acetyltransferase [unclassified Planococcus (in: firmicutes)]MBU9673729.1 GNAT family N-acetyltransferase [Planococcus sp. CP5-4_YE]MBV0908019.1 GNAT family N-acetyltransferase [Planococcus sp. CP5-4_UN]MBW6063186.1 GNAT family N-acetyltransferase [Planococcus sp. CP5-4]
MAVPTKQAVPDIFFTPEWNEAYATHEGGEFQQFEWKSELGHIVYPFIKRPVPLLEGWFDTITAFGQSGPVIIDAKEGQRRALVDEFDAAFQDFCEQQRIVSEYIRFSSWVKNAEDFFLHYGLDMRGVVMYIDLTVDDPFHYEFSSAARQQVRRALKNGVTLEYDFTGDTLDDFCRLYDLTADRNDFPDHYLFDPGMLKESFKHLEGKQFLLNAKYDGKTVSSALIVHHGDYMHYHLVANDPEYFRCAGNSLIMAEACRYGKELGFSQFHLGGASTEALYRFKRRFTKTEPLEILTGKRIRNSDMYGRLTELKRLQSGIENTGHFPLYRG